MRNKKCFVIHIFVAYLITYAHLLKTHKKLFICRKPNAFVERNSERGYLIWFLVTTQTLDFSFLWSFWIYPELGRDRFANAPWKSGSIKVSAFDTKADKSFIIERVYISTQCALNTYNIVMLYLHILFLHNSLKSQAYCTHIESAK